MVPEHFFANGAFSRSAPNDGDRERGRPQQAPRDPPVCSRLTRFQRPALVAAAAAIAVVAGVARGLEPDPSGRGTHKRLGLGECTFLAFTKHPCPSCGMTTSLAWFTRGRIRESARANVAGTFLALSSLAMVPWMVATAIAGRPLGAKSLETPLAIWVSSVVGVSLLAWVWRLIVGGNP